MRVSPSQLSAVIHELQAQRPNRRVRGVQVRAMLAERYGARAGTNRVYRAINETWTRQSAVQDEATPTVHTPLAPDERGAFVKRIEQLEHELATETAQISYYAVELDKLRMERKEARGARDHGKLLDTNLKLHRQLKERDDTIAEQQDHIRVLEQLLRDHSINIPFKVSPERSRFG